MKGPKEHLGKGAQGTRRISRCSGLANGFCCWWIRRRTKACPCRFRTDGYDHAGACRARVEARFSNASRDERAPERRAVPNDRTRTLCDRAAPAITTAICWRSRRESMRLSKARCASGQSQWLWIHRRWPRRRWPDQAQAPRARRFKLWRAKAFASRARDRASSETSSGPSADAVRWRAPSCRRDR